ncbi:MAG: TAXI family TRAP transporter solute-binding subunit [Hyphomicrobiales bacterium]|nr:TAXI family TRAP transporter solute-binding subunit [Hyphomicrobiales bacterium]
MIGRWSGAALACAIGFGGLSSEAAAQTALPSAIAITASEAGSIAFSLAGTLGKAIADRHAVDVQVVPAGNDVARLAPLRKGRAQIAAMGIGAYFAQEGAFEFAARGWGPQPLRLILAARDCSAISLGVAADIGVRGIGDLRGRRVGVVIGSPGLNHSTLAILGFGGLSPADVKLVDFTSYGAMWKAMAEGGVDAAMGSSLSAPVQEAAASKRGLMFPPTPGADTEGWKRLQDIAPYFMPQTASCGGGLSPERAVELPGYPFPVFVAYANEPAERMRTFARAMIDGYEANRVQAGAGATGLALAQQALKWVIPFHEGAVEALRQTGMWTDQQEAHNRMLLRRQAALAVAWRDYIKASDRVTDAVLFLNGWMTARRAALLAEGLDPVLE